VYCLIVQITFVVVINGDRLLAGISLCCQISLLNVVYEMSSELLQSRNRRSIG